MTVYRCRVVVGDLPEDEGAGECFAETGWIESSIIDEVTNEPVLHESMSLISLGVRRLDSSPEKCGDRSLEAGRITATGSSIMESTGDGLLGSADVLPRLEQENVGDTRHFDHLAPMVLPTGGVSLIVDKLSVPHLGIVISPSYSTRFSPGRRSNGCRD